MRGIVPACRARRWRQRNVDSAEAHAGILTRYDWEKIGEVVGGKGDTVTAGSKMFGGQEWDYVFDVDVMKRRPPRKLPANRGEDPYVIAERFLVQEGLPVSYRRALKTSS